MKRNAVAWAASVLSTAALVSSSGVLRPCRPHRSSRPRARKRPVPCPMPSSASPNSSSRRSCRSASRGRPGARRQSVRPDPNGRPGNPHNAPGQPMDLEELLRRFFGPDGPNPSRSSSAASPQGTGSGFVYDDKGHILTNNHVVEGAEKITVTFYDGEELPAKVVGTDPQDRRRGHQGRLDELPPAARGKSSKLKVGELVMAVGSPFGLEQTVTTGIISATGRNDVDILEREAATSRSSRPTRRSTRATRAARWSTWTARSSGSTRRSSRRTHSRARQQRRRRLRDPDRHGLAASPTS